MDWLAVLIGGGVGAVGLFYWNAIAWMVLHHHKGDYRPVPNNTDLSEVLQGVPPINAFYSLPHMEEYKQGMQDPKFSERMQKGPNAFFVVYPAGPINMKKSFLHGFLLNLCEAFAIAILIGRIARPHWELWKTMLVCAFIGLFVSMSIHGAMSIWSKFPWRFAWTSTFDKVIGYALAGIAIHYLGPMPQLA